MKISQIVFVAAVHLMAIVGPSFLSATTSKPPDAASPLPLTGIDWSLANLRGGVVGEEVPATIRFEQDGSLGGHDGCNAYRGTYSLDGSKLRIAEEMIATRMMCPEPLAGGVLAYTVALSKVSAYAIENGKLVLKGRGGARLAVFEAEIGDLTGSSWTVSAYSDGQEAVVSVLIGTEISARFGDDQRITGHAGCNGYFASYQAQNESISVGPPGATRKFCGEPEGIMEQESRFLAALETASIFRITGKKLELRTAEGSLAMTLLRADPKE